MHGGSRYSLTELLPSSEVEMTKGKDADETLSNHLKSVGLHHFWRGRWVEIHFNRRTSRFLRERGARGVSSPGYRIGRRRVAILSPCEYPLN